MPALHLPCQCRFQQSPTRLNPQSGQSQCKQPTQALPLAPHCFQDTSAMTVTIITGPKPTAAAPSTWGLLSPYFLKLLPLHLHFPSPGGCQAGEQIPPICWWSLHQCYLKPQRKGAALSRCQQWHGTPLSIHITSATLLGRTLFPRTSPHNLQKASKQKKNSFKICQLGYRFLLTP